MAKPLDDLRPPLQTHWDIAFTRLSRHFLRQVDHCVAALAPGWQAAGLVADLQVRQTPRGLSAFYAVVSPRGLLFILDFTLVDGMAVGRCAGAAADVRLLDARGDVLAQCPPDQGDARPRYHSGFAQILAASGECLQPGTVYAMARSCFDMTARQA